MSKRSGMHSPATISITGNRTATRFASRLLPALPAVVILALWQLSVGNDPRREFLFGSPLGILAEFREVASEGELFRDTAITATEAVLGFLGGTIVGSAFGMSLWFSELAFRMARPYLVALGSVPVFALGPVLIFWFGTGIWSKVVLGFLSTFVIAVIQAYTGATQADPNLLRLTKAFGGSRWQRFTKIVAPSSIVWVLAGIRLNIGMALLGAFIGEFIASRYGLGHMIIVAEGLYNVNRIWVGVVCIMMLAIFFHACTLPIERWASRWKR